MASETTDGPRKKPRVPKWLVAVLVSVAVATFLLRDEISRIRLMANLFDPDTIVFNFQHMDHTFDSRVIAAGGDVLEFGKGRVKASVTPDAAHLMPGDDPTSGMMGYGYQWWIPTASDGDFMALGVYGQTIYVDPKKDLVIVKNSVDLDFQKNGFENGQIAVALWRTIAADLSTPKHGEPR